MGVDQDHRERRERWVVVKCVTPPRVHPRGAHERSGDLDDKLN